MNNDKKLLEKILQKYFNCQKPFLSERKEIGTKEDPVYEYFTKSGEKAYERLTSLIEELCDLVNPDYAQNIIEELDYIVREELM